MITVQKVILSVSDVPSQYISVREHWLAKLHCNYCHTVSTSGVQLRNSCSCAFRVDVRIDFSDELNRPLQRLPHTYFTAHSANVQKKKKIFVFIQTSDPGQ